MTYSHDQKHKTWIYIKISSMANTIPAEQAIISLFSFLPRKVVGPNSNYDHISYGLHYTLYILLDSHPHSKTELLLSPALPAGCKQLRIRPLLKKSNVKKSYPVFDKSFFLLIDKLFKFNIPSLNLNSYLEITSKLSFLVKYESTIQSISIKSLNGYHPTGDFNISILY